MALTGIITGRVEAAVVSDVALSGPTTLVAGGFSEPTLLNDEAIVVSIKRLSGAYEKLSPPVVLSKSRNTAVLDATGTYSFAKSTTAGLADLGWE